jgi:hypothetical protein
LAAVVWTGLVVAGVVGTQVVGMGAVRAEDGSCPGDAGGSGAPGATATGVPVLQGRLVYHDGLRQWFELRLDRPACGAASIQLIADDLQALAVLRGCRVRSRGAIDFSPTGYYSLELFQDVSGQEGGGQEGGGIAPLGDCARQPPLPARPTAKPDPLVRAYRVEMDVDTSPGDHPVVFRATDLTASSAGSASGSAGGSAGGARALQPWQAYADYRLTGGFVLYGLCGEGFVVDAVGGTPEASPGHFTEARAEDDMAMFDPYGAADAGKTALSLTYTCVRP